MKFLLLYLAAFLITTISSWGQVVRFKLDILSSGDYSIADKLYYIVYPESVTDTSRVSDQASYIEKAFNLQGARRTYDKKTADVLINVSFARDRSRRTIYQEVKAKGNMGNLEDYKAERYRYSIENAKSSGIPTLTDSFDPAGNRTYQVRGYSSNHSFSMIVEGVSPSGERLFKTIATDYRSAAVTNAIVPYLSFATVGYLGKDTDCSEQFLSNNPFYLKWSEGLLDSHSTVLYPECNSSSKKVEVVSIIKDGDKTIVVLKDSRQKFFDKAEAFLEHGGNKFPASDIYKEARLPNNSYPAFTIWEFPVNSNNLKEFDVVFYSQKGKEKLAVRNIRLNN